MGMSFRGRGRGKLLLFGEHAAVLGYPALGLSLRRGIEIELEPRAEESHWSLEAREAGDGEIARAVMRRVGEAVADLPRGGRIRVEADLPEGRGFGSSAALCVALAEASLQAAGSPEVLRHRGLVWAIAHHAEGYFHGSPSGIDTGLASLGGLIAFAPRPPELPEFRRLEAPPLQLLVGSLPRRGLARDLIAGIKARASIEGSDEDGRLRRLGALSASAEGLLGRRELREGELAEELGGLAREAEAELSRLGLVDEGTALLLAEAERAGACGGKMSGAGGGGAFWLAYPSRKDALRGLKLLGERARTEGLAEALTLDVVGLGEELRS